MDPSPSTIDPRRMIDGSQRHSEINARLRVLRELRQSRRESAGLIEGHKAHLKIVDLKIEGLSADLVRLGDHDDQLDGMQTMLF